MVAAEGLGSSTNNLASVRKLRQLAATVLRGEQNGKVTPTMLMHEARRKLAHSPEIAETPPSHFRRIAARAMRQVFLELAADAGVYASADRSSRTGSCLNVWAARATLVGHSEPVAEQNIASVREKYLARNENSHCWVDFSDFSFFPPSPRRCLLRRWFSRDGLGRGP
jgi:hypothetical protein